MGLDGVELVMAFEEEFDLHLADNECEQLLTPGQVIAMLCEKLDAQAGGTCAGQARFNRLRRALVQQFGLAREAVRLELPLQPLLERGREQALWRELQEELGARTWPALERPSFVRIPLVLAGVALTAGCFAAAWSAAGPVAGLGLGLGCAALYTGAAARMTRSWKVRLPRPAETVRGLVRYAGPGGRDDSTAPWTREEVAASVKAIVIDQLGIPESQYREDARFIEDLGVG